MHRHRSAPMEKSAAQVNSEADDRLAYSVAEAARRLDVSPMTLYREIAAGRLAAIRIRDRLLIPRIVLERLIQDAIGRATELAPGGGSDAA
jgi:excisionase family DNA binding protein